MEGSSPGGWRRIQRGRGPDSPVGRRGAEIIPAWLAEHTPDRKEKVLSRIRDLRGGGLNDSRFGSRGRGEGVLARQIRDLFYAAARRNGLDGRGPELSAAAFRRPGGHQLGLFPQPE